MENLILRRGTSASSNFNNMTDEQLQEWHTAVLSEAQRENYVNHNLEIVRHYRTEAISRAPAFDIERNAIDAAIARHGLYASNASASESSACPEPVAGTQEEVQPPPLRRPRMEQPEQQQQQQKLEQQQKSEQQQASHSSSASAPAGSYGHYVALAHIFSDTFAGGGNGVTGAANGTANGNTNTNNNNNNEPEVAEINDLAIAKTIDSLGLRRT
ncbi:PREDICTED: nuclear transcription factor Y subunit gamma-like [Drosophila arizonae]|uniref:Nuclear transcription factor Y subunit gamma-like n=1 Tax=Drosophila arizonae TaxID=7263 RepID=A0ABM1PZN1_DROAR|nr:PREDICTED: nuclear transcription factor Y subunit gamma-like [Drosophila arizonae]